MRKIPFAIALTLALILLLATTPALAGSNQSGLLIQKNPTPTKLKNGNTYHYRGTVDLISSSYLALTLQNGSTISFKLTPYSRFHVRGGKWNSFFAGNIVKVRAVYRNGTLVATDMTLISAKARKH